MIVVIMISAGIMSAFMNNVAVAALMLPVVMDICRQTRVAPSRLLLPLAYGSLLGGLTTQIGTPPNILVTEALRENNLRPFALFDFTPAGLAVMIVGVVFMAVLGRRMLPSRSVREEVWDYDLDKQYRFQKRLFTIRIPIDSVLVNRSLADSRLGSALGINVVGISRQDHTLLAPSPSEIIRNGDRLVAEGEMGRLQNLSSWQNLVVEDTDIPIEAPFTDEINLVEVRLGDTSELTGRTLNELGFRKRFGVLVLAIRRKDRIRRTNIQDYTLETGDCLLIQGSRERLDALRGVSGLNGFRAVVKEDLVSRYHLNERLLGLRVPSGSALSGKTLQEARLGDAMGLRVLCIVRRDGTVRMPEPDEVLQVDDQLVVEGRSDDLNILRGLANLEFDTETVSNIESERVGLMETILSPHTTLVGRTLRQLHFREKHGLSVLAIWRQGQVYYDNLRDMALYFGDALLLYGPRDKFEMLGRESDFIVLTETAQEIPRLEKAKLSTLIMVGVMIPVILGWVPIYISTVVGAAIMVLTRCLTMEEAYRYIEWKAIFLIAGMLPLGIALDTTGAARLLAEGVVGSLGAFGPVAVMSGLLILTFSATCFVPTAALVVLMAPIVLKTAAELGLSPHSLMMGVALAASASFTTPVAHPANILVMGPGGYKFVDYVKVGGLLTLAVLATLMLVLPFFWPLANR
jgi:di/tricarboxylate transporter